MLDEKKLNAILSELDKKRQHKKDIQLAKAQAEIAAIQREYEAYYDGLYDAIKAVKNILSDEAAAGKVS